jgi:hypothetical protein
LTRDRLGCLQRPDSSLQLAIDQQYFAQAIALAQHKQGMQAELLGQLRAALSPNTNKAVAKAMAPAGEG